MRDFCGEVRSLCVSYLKANGVKAENERIHVANADCEAAYAIRDGLHVCLPEIEHPWFEHPLQKENRICFILGEDFYRDSALHIINEILPHDDGDVRDDTAYSRARMRMLSRKTGDSFPPDARRAIWRALCAHSADIPAAARGRYLDEAASLALSIGKAVPLRQRPEYMEGCGLAGACLSRLLNDEILHT